MLRGVEDGESLNLMAIGDTVNNIAQLGKLLDFTDITNTSSWVSTDIPDWHSDYLLVADLYINQTRDNKSISSLTCAYYSNQDLQTNDLNMNPEREHLQNVRALLAFALMVLSCTTSIFVVYVIFSNKEIRDAHPSKLLAMMSVCEFVSCSQAFIWLVGAGRLACYFKMDTFYYRMLKVLIAPYRFLNRDYDVNGLDHLIKANQ